MVPLSFANQEMLLTRSGALFWPRERALLVADLHLEKASFFAAHGQMLPPYDSRDTLERVASAVRETGARRVITLGDNFHDDDGTLRLEPYAAGMLEALTRSMEWIWITGNHDENMHRTFGGDLAEELEIGDVVLRHRAQRGEARAELSGHYHPKLRPKLHGRHIARPCGVISSGRNGAQRMILPAFGSLTGGMDAQHREILKVLQPASAIEAVVPTGRRLARFPLWQAAA